MIKVMIVDDEKIVRLGLQSLADWEDLGFSLSYEASNGLQALELLEQHPEIRIVFADIQMPKMDGLQFLEEVARRKYPVAVIVLSAHDRYDLIRKAFRLGVFDYVIKTEMNREEILKQLRNASLKLNLIDAIDEDYSRPVSLAKKFIKDNFTSKSLSLAMVSSHVGISENHLSSIFARQTGKTITEYITQMRVERAKTLLKDTNYKVYEIAEHVGFTNTEYFSKIFKKYTGKSPNRYYNRYY